MANTLYYYSSAYDDRNDLMKKVEKQKLDYEIHKRQAIAAYNQKVLDTNLLLLLEEQIES